VNYNGVNMEKIHILEQSNIYGFFDLKYYNHIYKYRHPNIIIIQLDNTNDDLSISKIIFHVQNCDEYTLKNNYFIKKYLGFNMLVIFLCKNINSLNEIKNSLNDVESVKDFIKGYEPLEITKLILGKNINKIEIYDENDKLLTFNNYVIL
jgi:hypothetical protein